MRRSGVDVLDRVIGGLAPGLPLVPPEPVREPEGPLHWRAWEARTPQEIGDWGSLFGEPGEGDAE